MRFSGLIWWIGALLFAALAGILAYGLLSNSSSVTSSVGLARDTQQVVVAASDIPFRRSISEAELTLQEFPAEAVPEGAAVTFDQVLGKMSTTDIFNGEPVLVQQLVLPDIVTQQVALSVPQGKIVTTVPTDSELVRHRLIRPGDRVDLLATFELEVIREQGSSPMPESIALLQNTEVHAIVLPMLPDLIGTQEGGVFRSSDQDTLSVLLAVEPQDALTIRHILDVDGHIDLALRAPDDESLTDITAVDQFYLADRYQINLVRGRPNLNSNFLEGPDAFAQNPGSAAAPNVNALDNTNAVTTTGETSLNGSQ